MSDAGEGNQGIAQARAAPSAFPSDYRPIVFEGFETLNVKAPRAAIKDSEMAWCDGWMPIAPNVVRILPDVGDVKYSAPGGLLVMWFAFGNIGDTNYGYALLSNGQLDAFDTATGAVFPVIPAGGVAGPNGIFGSTQWGSLYALFCNDQDNGYWLWDGTNLFMAGTLAPDVLIDNAGSGYTSAPSFNMRTVGAGSGATFSGEIQNESLVKVTVTSPGSGFGIEGNDFTVVDVSGGGSDTQAVPTVPAISISTGGVSQVIVHLGGNGYTSRAYGVFVPVDGFGSGAVASLAIENGTVTTVSIVNPGTGYTQPPTFVVADPGIPGSPSIPGGTGFSGFCNIEFGQITGIGLTNGGTGYTTPPDVQIIGDGSGATAIAEVSGGAVVNIIMNRLGSGYTVAIVRLTSGNRAANVSVHHMPFGISGTAMEVYQSRVWVANGAARAPFPPKNRVIYSAPSSPTDFGNGGGAFQSNDSFLRVGYHWLRQSNGFLYCGGDSSTNYISGVATSAPSSGSPITTFSNQNVDPQIGSPWPPSVQVFSRNIVIANPQGVFVSYGGAMTKVSTPIDPLFASSPNLNTQGFYFSSAVAQIFNVPVYMLLLNVIDAITGTEIYKLLMWDGKRWFTSQQSRALGFIATQEINSNLTAWATDSTDIFPLFQKPSTAFTKTLVSKLFSFGYFMTKTLVRLQGVAQGYVMDEPLVIFLDSDAPGNLPSPSYSVPIGGSGVWLGSGGGSGTWMMGGSVGVWLSGQSTTVFGPIPVGQWGRLLGFQVSTIASDIALMSILGEAQEFAANV